MVAEMKMPAQVAEDWMFEEAPNLWQLEPSEIKEIEDSVAALLRQRDEEHRRYLGAAQSLCTVYFEIAAEALGEDEVRRRRDARIEGRKKGEGDAAD